MQRFREHTLQENTGLERIVNHMRRGVFGMMSANRNEYDDTENEARTRKLHLLIKGMGFDFIETEGGYVENGDIEVDEDSVFILADADQDIPAFREIMQGLCDEFDQESYIYGDTESVWLVNADGTMDRIGVTSHVQTKDVGQYYTKINGTKFAFTTEPIEEAVEDNGIDHAIEQIDMSDVDSLVESIETFLGEFGVYVTVNEQTDIDVGDVLFGGAFDSHEDEAGEPSIEVEVFVNPDTSTINEKHADSRIYMLRSVLLHELRHQYQYRARGYVNQRRSDAFGKDGNYLANPDEVDAYAIDIANDLFREYGSGARHRLSKPTELAISRNEDGELVSPSLYAYITEFKSDHPVVKSLMKKVYKRLDTITESVLAEPLNEIFYNFKPTVQWFKETPLFHITLGEKAQSIIASNSFRLAPIKSEKFKSKSPEEKISPKRYRTPDYNFMSLAYDLNNSYAREVVKYEQAVDDVVAFELDGGRLAKDFDLWNVDYRKAFPILGWMAYGNEKEIRLFSQKKTIDNALQYVTQVHVMLERFWDISWKTREYLLNLIEMGIPVFIYSNRGAFLKRNTQKAKIFTDKRFKRINRYNAKK